MWGIDDIIKTVKSWIVSFIKSWGWLWSRITSIVKSYTDSVKNWAISVINGLSNWFNSKISGVKNWVNSTVRGLRNWIETSIRGIKEALESRIRGIENWVNSTVSGLRDWVRYEIRDVSNFIKGIGKDVKELLLGGIGRIREFLINWLMEMIVSLAISFTEGLTAGIQNMEKRIKEIRRR
ncbi:hypothetical protein DRQ29_00350 [bacterium]|nr:MAG: hypothetical protein DRQ29_00350 [bacterium]